MEKEETNELKPSVVFFIGMAGSGKTTLLQRMNLHLHENKKKPYVLNLDPAVVTIPYPANIDIRDTVNYKEVMKQYKLGPNGAILTSLNLFSTRFDKVIEILEKRVNETNYILCDTPGQIEVFTWSASGTIITESLSSTLPTVILYVIDTPRCSNPITFMSNMLYSCSILYKLRLPMVLAFNKSDVIDPSFAIDWMKDYESFQEALEKDTTYMSSLAKSMSLTLDEFYQNMNFVKVSAYTGEGMSDLLEKISVAVEEYHNVFIPELQEIKKRKEAAQFQENKEFEMKLGKESQPNYTLSATEEEEESDDEDFFDI